MLCRIILLLVCVTVSACSDSGDDTPMNTDNTAMTDPTSTGNSAAGSVAIDASVRLWTDSNLTIDYTLTNNGSFELIVFDVGFTVSTELGENEQVRLLKAKLDTGNTLFEQAPTIAGRNLSPEQTINGSANQRIPISIDYSAPLVSGLTPDAIEFCVGYGNADDIIPTTRPDGTYSLNEDLQLQTLICATLIKP